MPLGLHRILSDFLSRACSDTAGRFLSCIFPVTSCFMFRYQETYGCFSSMFLVSFLSFLVCVVPTSARIHVYPAFYFIMYTHSIYACGWMVFCSDAASSVTTGIFLLFDIKQPGCSQVTSAASTGAGLLVSRRPWDAAVYMSRGSPTWGLRVHWLMKTSSRPRGSVRENVTFLVGFNFTSSLLRPVQGALPPCDPLPRLLLLVFRSAF